MLPFQSILLDFAVNSLFCSLQEGENHKYWANIGPILSIVEQTSGEDIGMPGIYWIPGMLFA